ncbi:MAG: diguanylate cyclase, partial [Clostridiaceae bacterium]|nr:diguanylate cyclase [Clostridiaceae bacterium]
MLIDNNIDIDLLIFEKMNKGAVILKSEGLDDDGETLFKIAYANPHYFEMLAEECYQLINKKFPLSHILNEKQLEKVSVLQKKGDSTQFEYLHPKLNRWHLLSIYCQQESHLVVMFDDITEKKMLEQELAESEKILRMTLEIAGEGIWEWHYDEQLVYHNKRWAKTLGLPEEAGYHDMDFYMSHVHPDDLERLKATLDEATRTEQPYFSEHRMVLDDGSTIWIVDRGIPVKDKNGRLYRMIGSQIDTSKYKQAHQDLFLEKEMIRSTILSVGDGIITTDIDGKINIMNPAAEALTGWKSEELFGLHIDYIFKLVDDNNGEGKTVFSSLDRDDSESFEYSKERRAKLQNRRGNLLDIYYNTSQIHLPAGQTHGYIIVFTDISEFVEAQKQIEYLSLHDDLTGLYNRHYLRDALHRLDSKRLLPITIMVLDINGLKAINDSYGHDEGDKLIKLTADFLRSNYRQEDIVARIGGDEFCILLPNTSAPVAEGIKERLLKGAAEQEGTKHPISLSIGYAIKTDENEDIDHTLIQADRNMYEH